MISVCEGQGGPGGRHGSGRRRPLVLGLAGRQTRSAASPASRPPPHSTAAHVDIECVCQGADVALGDVAAVPVALLVDLPGLGEQIAEGELQPHAARRPLAAQHGGLAGAPSGCWCARSRCTPVLLCHAAAWHCQATAAPGTATSRCSTPGLRDCVPGSHAAAARPLRPPPPGRSAQRYSAGLRACLRWPSSAIASRQDTQRRISKAYRPGSRLRCQPCGRASTAALLRSTAGGRGAPLGAIARFKCAARSDRGCGAGCVREWRECVALRHACLRARACRCRCGVRAFETGIAEGICRIPLPPRDACLCARALPPGVARGHL
jgi:hypothetical protein